MMRSRKDGRMKMKMGNENGKVNRDGKGREEHQVE